jgi:agmatinase (EC 3.5.3.11)
VRFPGASAPADAAAYTIIGAPLDRSASFRAGARTGPTQIRAHAGHFDDYDHHTETHLSALSVADVGDVDPFSPLGEYLRWLEGRVRDVVAAGAVPVLLGGEHTITRAGVTGTGAAGVVVADAHLDLRDALAGDADSHATVLRHVGEVPDVEAVLIVGARTGSADEWERVDTPPFGRLDAPGDVASVMAETAVDRWYLSVDIDVVDPGFAPATGTPEPFGLAPSAIRELVATVAPACVGMDIVEVTDRDAGQTATLAARLVRTFLHAHAAGAE